MRKKLLAQQQEYVQRVIHAREGTGKRQGSIFKKHPGVGWFRRSVVGAGRSSLLTRPVPALRLLGPVDQFSDVGRAGSCPWSQAGRSGTRVFSAWRTTELTTNSKRIAALVEWQSAGVVRSLRLPIDGRAMIGLRTSMLRAGYWSWGQVPGPDPIEKVASRIGCKLGRRRFADSFHVGIRTPFAR